jgi:hypothetical protein
MMSIPHINRDDHCQSENLFGFSTRKIVSMMRLSRHEQGFISFQTLIFLLVLIAVVLFLLRTPSPCKEPLTYRIGTVDERFGLSREEFSRLVGKAASVWSVPLSRELFREEPAGKIVINLIYDYRQAAADRLKRLNYAISNTRNSYNELKVRFETLKTEFEQKKQEMEEDLKDYNNQVQTFNEENEAGRRRGGVTEEVYQRLQRDKENLNTLQDHLQSRQEELKRMADTLNSMVIVINEIALEHNLDTVTYRDEGSKLGEEFSKGHYARKGLKEDITIYQFDSEKGLVRVLVHEFGHALGIEHNDDPQAIMHRLVQDEESFNLTPADIAALKTRCGGS